MQRFFLLKEEEEEEEEEEEKEEEKVLFHARATPSTNKSILDVNDALGVIFHGWGPFNSSTTIPPLLLPPPTRISLNLFIIC